MVAVTLVIEKPTVACSCSWEHGLQILLPGIDHHSAALVFTALGREPSPMQAMSAVVWGSHNLHLLCIILIIHKKML